MIVNVTVSVAPTMAAIAAEAVVERGPAEACASAWGASNVMWQSTFMMIATTWQSWRITTLVALIEAKVNATASAGASVRQTKRTELLHTKLVFVLLHDVCTCCLRAVRLGRCGSLRACEAQADITSNWSTNCGAVTKRMTIAYIRTARRAC